MKKRFVIHPFLFGLFFVLALYSANVHEVSVSQVVVPILIVIAGTAVILLSAWLLLRSPRRAALLTSVAVILCFSYGHVVNLVASAAAGARSSAGSYNFSDATPFLKIVILMAWGVVFGVSVYFFVWAWKKRWNRNLPKMTTLLNVVAAALVVVPLITIVVEEARGTGHNRAASDSVELELSVPEQPPDIYYIILDRYASAATLKERLDFDNSEFLTYLSDKGFYVASESRGNYFSTHSSLASSLNMEYLDGVVEEVGVDETDLSLLFHMLQDYKVWRLLRSADYQFVHVGSWWEPTRVNKYADINVNYRGTLPEFSGLLLSTTAVDTVGKTLNLWGDELRNQYERVKYEFDWLGRVPQFDEPTFVFAHFLTPHPDYVFDKNGDYLTVEESAGRSLETQYLDQLVATNNMVEACIDRIISESDVPPVIVLQADEGPYPDFMKTFSWDQSRGNNLDLRVKSGILNAYYFPGADQNVFYPSITPVNSFRLVFNLYFGSNLEALPDRYYLCVNTARPFDFTDVTEILLGPAA